MKKVINTTVAGALNQDCHCLTLDRHALARALDAELGAPGLSAAARERCPTVFAAQPVFVAAHHLRRMAAVVQAIESVVALPVWHAQVLATAPETARVVPPPGQSLPRSVFFGHDFHLDHHQGHDQLSLIEVNTNAGGALLHAVIADPAALDWRAGRLWHGDTAIDLVYNRLTDFYFDHSGRQRRAARRVWEEITARDGDYVVQAFAPPGQRQLQADADERQLKADHQLSHPGRRVRAGLQHLLNQT